MSVEALLVEFCPANKYSKELGNDFEGKKLL